MQNAIFPPPPPPCSSLCSQGHPSSECHLTAARRHCWETAHWSVVQRYKWVFFLFFFVRRKRVPHRQPSCVIYTWMQVNGVSVADPSHSDSSDPLFLLMSDPLVSFFLFFSLLSLSFHLSSLSWKKKRKWHSPPQSSLLNKSSLPLSLSPSFALSVSLSLFFFFFSHTPTYHPQCWQAAAHPACCIHSSQRLSAINHMTWWFLLQACLSGSGGRNLYSCRYGQFPKLHILSRRKIASHRCDLLSFFSSFSGKCRACFP